MKYQMISVIRDDSYEDFEDEEFEDEFKEEVMEGDED